MLPSPGPTNCILHAVSDQGTACTRGNNAWPCSLSRGYWLSAMCAVVMLKFLFLTLT